MSETFEAIMAAEFTEDAAAMLFSSTPVDEDRSETIPANFGCELNRQRAEMFADAHEGDYATELYEVFLNNNLPCSYLSRLSRNGLGIYFKRNE